MQVLQPNWRHVSPCGITRNSSDSARSPHGVRVIPRGLARNTWGTVKTSIQETPNLECWSNETCIYDSDCSQRFNTRSSTLSESRFNLSNCANGLSAWRNSIHLKLIFSCDSVCMALQALATINLSFSRLSRHYCSIKLGSLLFRPGWSVK